MDISNESYCAWNWYSVVDLTDYIHILTEWVILNRWLDWASDWLMWRVEWLLRVYKGFNSPGPGFRCTIISHSHRYYERKGGDFLSFRARTYPLQVLLLSFFLFWQDDQRRPRSQSSITGHEISWATRIGLFRYPSSDSFPFSQPWHVPGLWHCAHKPLQMHRMRCPNLLLQNVPGQTLESRSQGPVWAHPSRATNLGFWRRGVDNRNPFMKCISLHNIYRLTYSIRDLH